MKSKDKYIYKIIDPLFGKVICIHNKPNMKCKKCLKVEREQKTLYSLEERKCLIKT